MRYIDLLQELGRARRALEDLIAATSGPGTKDLLTRRDAITSAMDRVAGARAQLESADVSEVVSNLDDVATKLGRLTGKTKDVASAVALAGKAAAIVDGVLAATDRRARAAPAVAPTLQAPAPDDGQRFTAFCNTHNVELPPTKVTLDRAIQNESDHLAVAGNEDDDVDIILVK